MIQTLPNPSSPLTLIHTFFSKAGLIRRASAAPLAVITPVNSIAPAAGTATPLATTSVQQTVKGIDGHVTLYGLGVKEVLKGSPAQQAGLVPLHDVVIKVKNAQGVWVDVVHESCGFDCRQFARMANEHEGRPMELRVYNTISYDSRVITIVPGRWNPSGPGSLLGMRLVCAKVIKRPPRPIFSM